MIKKQYIVEPSNAGHHIVLLYINGELKSREIIPDHTLEVYTGCVENLGYTRAYYMPIFEKRLELAYAAYREAVEALEKAKYHPLEIGEVEGDMLMKLVGEWGER